MNAGALELCQWCGGDAIAGSTCPRSLACPDCRQPAGSPCRRPSDHRADTLHASRIRAAEQLDELAGINYPRPPIGADVDEHAGGQLRLGAAGDQLELLPLQDSAIPADDTVPPTPAELELERRHHERSTAP